jgi:hypothetical protein
MSCRTIDEFVQIGRAFTEEDAHTPFTADIPSRPGR